MPSDDPTQIGQDSERPTTISKSRINKPTNIQAATAQLTSTDSALANLTSVLQSAEQLATRGASDLHFAKTERQDVGNKSINYLQQTVAIANTQYGGSYLFGGSAQSSSPPVTTAGSPVSSVPSTERQSQAPMLFNGQNVRAFADAPASVQLRRHERFAVGLSERSSTCATRSSGGVGHRPERAIDQSRRAKLSTAPARRRRPARQPWGRRPRPLSVVPTADGREAIRSRSTIPTRRVSLT